MIDLTNKTIDEINSYVQKYADVVQLFHPQDQPYVAYVVHIGYNYLNEKYGDLPTNWKSWSILILTKEFNIINSDNDIHRIIDEFVTYQKNNYMTFGNDMISATEYDKDRGFVYKFLSSLPGWDMRNKRIVKSKN